MKLLGMIGGTGPESTVEYYRRLIAAYHARVSESGAPPIIINSVDNKNLVKWFTAGDLAAVINFLAAEIERLARAGADFGLIAAVTPHLVFDELRQRARIPLLSIVEATADAAAAGVGAILEETRRALIGIVETIKQRNNIDGLILGGTELSLILREPTAVGLPVLDTTQIHVEAAIEWMLRE
ncbi:MAG: hypothetical protein E6L06_03340 [Verrucomicrobia bacterium]|nr:MAG: hypothetical protein E6L06_03340 [Verrucomicrobiota bacterium]